MKLTNLMRWTVSSQPEGYALVGTRTSNFWRFSQWFSREPWNSVSKTRLFVASIASVALFGGAVTAGIAGMNQSGSWTKVFANGSYVGLVPNHQGITDAIQRVAIGYHVNVSLSPVHTFVNPRYHWQRVQSLPMPAVAIVAGGHPLVYTATKRAAEQALSDVRVALMPKTLIPNAKIAFTTPIHLSQTTVGIASIWSPVAAAEHITHPNLAQISGRAISLSAIVSSGLDHGHGPVHRVVLPGHSETSLKMNETSLSHGKMGTPFSTSLTRNELLGRRSNPLVSLKVTETVQKTMRVEAPVHYVKNDSMAVGANRVITKGKSGVAKERLNLEFINGKLENSTVVERRLVSSPIAEVIEEGTNSGVASGGWIWPSPYTDITSPFGWRILNGRSEMHPGVDIGCPIGTPIYASNNGVIEDAGWNDGGYGNWVRMSNGNGVETVYGHMSQVAVSAGQTVAKGQVIGYSGDTGDATGPHLHYEVRVNGTPVEPTPYM